LILDGINITNQEKINYINIYLPEEYPENKVHSWYLIKDLQKIIDIEKLYYSRLKKFKKIL